MTAIINHYTMIIHLNGSFHCTFKYAHTCAMILQSHTLTQHDIKYASAITFNGNKNGMIIWQVLSLF